MCIRDRIRSAFAEPLRQRERRGAVGPALGDDSLDPSETLFDLIRNIEIPHRDHELIDTHATSRDRSQPPVHLGRPAERVSPAVRLAPHFERHVTPLGPRVRDQSCLGVVPPGTLREELPVHLSCIQYYVHDDRPKPAGVPAGFGPLLRRSRKGLQPFGEYSGVRYVVAHVLEHDVVVLEYVRNYVSNARVLAEGLQALAAAAEERAKAGRHARRLWPIVMDVVLDAAEVNRELFAERTWGDYAEAALIPNPGAEWGYVTLEMGGEPYCWRDPLSWAPQVDRWLGAITRSRMSIDQLVIAVRDLDVADQVEQGLRWIERIVAESGANCASTFTLPEWLRERRADLVTNDHIGRWQRVVDLLFVAGDSRVADLAD